MQVVRKVTIGGERLPTKVESFGKLLTTEEAVALFFERAEALKKRDPRYLRAILIGSKGSGKTYSCIKTLPRPILFLVFDPDADRIVRPEEIWSGQILPILYYGDDPNRPTAYAQYERDLETWKNNGFFQYFASVVVDGLSTMTQVHLRQIAYEDAVAKEKLAQQDPRAQRRESLMPQLRDYSILKTSSILGFMSLCAVPCHVVLTAHIAEEPYYADERETIMRLRRFLNSTPALQANIPPLFSEVYMAFRKEDGSFWWKTQQDKSTLGLPIVTRFNRDGFTLPPEIPQDFRALLKSVGYLYEDKPFLSLPKEGEQK